MLTHAFQNHDPPLPVSSPFTHEGLPTDNLPSIDTMDIPPCTISSSYGVITILENGELHLQVGKNDDINGEIFFIVEPGGVMLRTEYISESQKKIVLRRFCSWDMNPIDIERYKYSHSLSLTLLRTIPLITISFHHIHHALMSDTTTHRFSLSSPSSSSPSIPHLLPLFSLAHKFNHLTQTPTQFTLELATLHCLKWPTASPPSFKDLTASPCPCGCAPIDLCSCIYAFYQQTHTLASSLLQQCAQHLESIFDSLLSSHIARFGKDKQPSVRKLRREAFLSVYPLTVTVELSPQASLTIESINSPTKLNYTS